jgi:isoleucyl-tRNA synthetase/glutamate dehydrogenase/leucine dehydrogenase
MPKSDYFINKPTTDLARDPEESALLNTQKRLLQKWHSIDMYRGILEERRDRPLYVLHDGPPFASEIMNIGVGLNKTLKDVLIKFKTMTGHRVPFVPGWDCHGLPIESALQEGRAKVKGDQRAAFRVECMQAVVTHAMSQRQQFQALGVFADWERPYHTMSPLYEASTLEVLEEFARRKYVQHMTEEIPFCTHCVTVLAEMEIEKHGEREVCHKCGTPVELRSEKHWYINLDHSEAAGSPMLRDRAIQALDEVVFTPGTVKDDLRTALKKRRAWRISRNRLWGVPLPALHCEKCDLHTLDPEVIREVRDVVAQEGSQAWFSRPLSEILKRPRKCSKCAGDLAPGREILDSWFESATSWRAVLMADSRLQFPADVCVEGKEQIDGWFQFSHLTSVLMRGRPAFRKAIAHGFVLDACEQRMSRLRGSHLVTLQDAIEALPVDLLRLYFLWNRHVSSDAAYSQGAVRDLLPIYKAFRRTLHASVGHLDKYDPVENAVPFAQLRPLDQWMLCRLHRLINSVTAHYEALRISEALHELHQFCTREFGQVYEPSARDRLAFDSRQSESRRKAQTVMHSVAIALTKMLAPVLVYTAEEIWELVPGTAGCASVHLSLWPLATDGFYSKILPSKSDPGRSQVEFDVDTLIAVRAAVQPLLSKARRRLAARHAEPVTTKLTLFVHKPRTPQGAAVLQHREELSVLLDGAEVVISKEARHTKALAGVPGVSGAVALVEGVSCFRCKRARGDHSAADPAFCARCSKAEAEAKAVDTQRPVFQLSKDSPPSDLAAYLRSRDIRRVALLFENGRGSAYYYHSIKDALRVSKSLQRIVDYVAKHQDYKGHAAILLGIGAHTNCLFAIGLHSLVRGTPLGGTREMPYRSVGDLLEDLLRLSHGMSLKNALGDLPHGGGKSIIDPSGIDFKVHRELRRRVYRDFGQFTASLGGRYICAEDVGNTDAETRDMLAFCRHVMCLPQMVGGGGNPSRFTAFVAWRAARAGWEFNSQGKRKSLDGCTVAMQGTGNVGTILAQILLHGEKLKRLYIADKVPEKIEALKQIAAALGKADVVQEAPSDKNSRGYILYQKCDILIPVALGKVISEKNVHRLNCEVIVPVANNVYDDPRKVAALLAKRKIIDVVEGNINWGGAMMAASELFGYDEGNVLRYCDEMGYKGTLKLLERAAKDKTTAWEITQKIAEKRIGVPHPIIEEVRKSKFLGDVSRNLTQWLMKKWLPGRFNIPRDDYPAAVATGTWKR